MLRFVVSKKLVALRRGGATSDVLPTSTCAESHTNQLTEAVAWSDLVLHLQEYKTKFRDVTLFDENKDKKHKFLLT